MDRAARMQAAFEHALELRVPAIYAFFRRLGVTATSADDLVQDTFLTAWRTLGRVRCEEDLKPWLYGIAYRSYLRYRRHSAREAAELTEEVAGTADDPGSDAQLTLQAVRDVLQHLPDRYLQPLVLVYWEGLSYEEAARALSLPVGTLGWRVHRALQLVRRALEKEGQGHDALSPEPRAE